jgi:hypothetical protein
MVRNSVEWSVRSQGHRGASASEKQLKNEKGRECDHQTKYS